MKLRKFIRTSIYYLLPIFLIFLFMLGGNNRLFSRFGEISLGILTVVLFVRPLQILFSFKFLKILMTYRRELGISSFWFLLFHAGGKILTYNLTLRRLTDTNNHLFWASLAAVGMIIMGVTANDYSVRLLRKNWKKLHRIAYPVYFFALYHVGRARGEPYLLYLFGGVYIILKALQYAKVRKL